MEWVYMYVHFENQRYNPSKKTTARFKHNK